LTFADAAVDMTNHEGIEIGALSPDERHLYVTTPVAHRVVALERDGTGALSLLQVVTDSEAPLRGAAGVVATDERVIVAARDSDALVVLDRASDGRLTPAATITHPSLDWPNGLALHPSEPVLLVAATGSNAVLSFRVSPGGDGGCAEDR